MKLAPCRRWCRRLLVASIWKKYAVPGVRPLRAAVSAVFELPVTVGWTVVRRRRPEQLVTSEVL